MSTFKKELRYYVIKVSDAAVLDEGSKRDLTSILRALHNSRICRGKPNAIDCVVVESDWPEYDIVWAMIQSRVEGRPNRIEELEAELATLKASMPVCVGYVSIDDADTIRRHHSDTKVEYVTDVLIWHVQDAEYPYPIYLEPLPKEATECVAHAAVLESRSAERAGG